MQIYRSKQYLPAWVRLTTLLVASVSIAASWFSGSVVMVVVILIAVGMLTSLILSLALKISVDASGIHFQLIPLHRQPISYIWSEIEAVEIVTYKPLKKFGGWGLRTNAKGERAYTVSGNTAMRIQCKSEIIYLGIESTAELRNTLSTYSKPPLKGTGESEIQ